MELYTQLLAKILQEREICVRFTGLQDANPNDLVKDRCYKTLEIIRNILGQSELSDFACIELIVQTLELAGSNGNGRHDF